MFYDLETLFRLVHQVPGATEQIRSERGSTDAMLVRRLLSNHAHTHANRFDCDGLKHRLSGADAHAFVRDALPAVLALVELEQKAIAAHGTPVVVIDGDELTLEDARRRFPHTDRGQH